MSDYICKQDHVINNYESNPQVSFETRLKKIEDRNKKVEADEAWEISKK